MPVLLEYWLDVPDAHAVVEVLLVGEDQQWNARQIFVLNHFIEEIFGLVHPVAVVGVDHIDHRMRLVVILKREKNCEISALDGHEASTSSSTHLIPERLQLLLSTKVPEAQSDTRQVNLSNVESNGGRNELQIHSFVIFGKFRLRRLQESRLSGIIQAQYQHVELVLFCQQLVESR